MKAERRQPIAMPTPPPVTPHPSPQPPLHPRLTADCHRLGEASGVTVLLHRNASLHWFLLVPATTRLDLTDLPPEDQQTLLQLATSVAKFLKQELAYPRVNLGALGLLVPQLHLHVIGRREDDPCWPNPVWGQLPAGPSYSDEALENLASWVASLDDDQGNGA